MIFLSKQKFSAFYNYIFRFEEVALSYGSAHNIIQNFDHSTNMTFVYGYLKKLKTQQKSFICEFIFRFPNLSMCAHN